MEANKDAALHYLELAEKAMHVNEIERATRYINKSESLYPTAKAKDLLAQLKDLTFKSTNHQQNSHSSNSASSNTDHTTRHRTTSTSTTDYTAEEVEAVRKIKTCKDFYEILGVSKTVSDADLKKAYRKLALQFHPDKCKAPGATEAFKAIGKAFAVLNDPKKREDYDQYGHTMEAQNNFSNHTGGRQYYYNCDVADDFSAEEIFNMFFGHAAPPNRVHRRRHQRNSHHSTTNSSQTTFHPIIQLLPYILLFLVSIIGTLFVSDPQFQLYRTGKYNYLRTTRSSNIQYYVRSDFRSPKTEADLNKLESAVTEEYISDLRQRCQREQQNKESLLWRARMMNDNKLYHQAQQQTTPSCTKFNNFIRTSA